jgi:hypothetical protein
MNIAEQVQTAIRNYENLAQTPLDDSVTPESLYMATPDRLAYALGWIVANAIVANRFATSAIDVLPVFHPENGWDRFLITRRVSCGTYANEPADKFGLIMLDGEDGPRLTTGSGRTRLALGQALRDDPGAAISDLLAHIPAPGIVGEKHTRCSHTIAPKYPLYYNAVTELIVENPGVVAAREIYIDDEEIDGQYHPLYLHAVALSSSGPGDRTGMLMPVIVYEWFQLQQDDLFAFFDLQGKRTVYRTDHGTWSRVRKQLNEEPDENVKQRIGNWMRIGGHPDAENDSPREGLTPAPPEEGDASSG